MPLIGGSLAYRFLRHRYPGGAGVPMSQGDPFAERGVSKLATFFGPGVFESLRGNSVVDFGCGAGGNALELAENGCDRVVGVDIQEHLLQSARAAALSRGLQDKVTFAQKWDEKVDVVLSTDAFEHFEDPARILTIMRSLLKPNGYILTTFGPTWLHPLGGHLFSVFPWAHLIFTEASLIRWRSDFKSDGARHFGEVAGGLNQLTIAKWEKLVADSGMLMSEYRLIPIRAARQFHNRFTREYLTSAVVAQLREPARQSG